MTVWTAISNSTSSMLSSGGGWGVYEADMVAEEAAIDRFCGWCDVKFVKVV
jgi:hypothetical protein